MILGIDQGIEGGVLDMEKKMGWFPRLETAENDEFLKSIKIFGTLLSTQNGLKTIKVPRSQDQFQPLTALVHVLAL